MTKGSSILLAKTLAGCIQFVQSAKQAKAASLPGSLQLPLTAPNEYSDSDGVLRLGTTAPAMRTIGVARELHHLAIPQPQHLLELLPDPLQHVLPLLRRPSLPARHVAIAAAWHALPNRARPQPDPIEAFAHVHDDTHDFAVVVFLERFANRGEHRVQPELVDGHGALLFEAVGPLAAVLVLRVFPFGSHAFFEEVVVGF
jgi:hypothetical protein